MPARHWRAGYLPVTFDNLERGHERAVKWGPLERGDLSNNDDLSAFTHAFKRRTGKTPKEVRSERAVAGHLR